MTALRSTTSTTGSTHRNQLTTKRPQKIQQLPSISYYYAPTFFETMKLQKLDNLRQQGFEEEQVQHQETVLQKEKILELYINLEYYLDDEAGSYVVNGTDETHSWYNFHTELQYAVNDFLNIYLHNYPAEYPQPGQQLTGQDTI
eukprot:4719042-Amphidinium_carterae.6